MIDDCTLLPPIGMEVIRDPKSSGYLLGYLETQEGPLSLWSDFGSSKQGTVALNRSLNASHSFSVWVGKAPIHHVNVLMKTGRYLQLFVGGMLV